MARTLEQIQQQIDKLNELAERVKAKNKAGVVQRIQQAIDYYGLTPAELFGAADKPARKTRGPGRKNKRALKKSPSPIRYRDDNGNGWTGHGQRPRWFKEALANGRTREELAVKA